MIADELISEIRDRTDIVALIGEYVSLKQRGGSFVGLCPFHNEKTPSFNVRRDRQFFHCFGCKESGDALAFLMRLEGLTFPQAARELAQRAGIELPDTSAREDPEQRRERERAERMYALMETAAAFYVEQLARHPLSRAAREELERRGIGAATAEKFRIGYAPHGWDPLTRYFEQRGHALPEAEALGLLVRRRDGGGYYDRFRHRLQFPVRDLHGRVVAFSGRILPLPDGGEAAAQEPKYVNSPEGPIYKKGELLYGLHEARVDIRRHGWAVVCEGNFDLVSLHQAGIGNAVAPLGTAFTQAQVALLRRFAQRVTLMFDGDSAGKKAVKAAFPLLQAAELSARVVALPPGDDPDSYLRRHGAAGLARLVENAEGIVEHLIDAAADSSAAAAQDRAAAIGALGPLLVATKNPVEVQIYIERIARRFGIQDTDVVRRQLRAGAQREREKERPAGGRQTKLAAAAPRVKLPELEIRLLGALIDKPELLRGAAAQSVKELLTDAELRSIFAAAAAAVEEHGTLDGSRLLAATTNEVANEWLKGILSVEQYEDQASAEAVVHRGVPLLAKRNIEGELPALAARIREARARGDEAGALALTKQRDERALHAHRLVKGLKR